MLALQDPPGGDCPDVGGVLKVIDHRTRGARTSPFSEEEVVLSSSASVPAGLVHPAFVAVPLSTANVELDYAAYMASPAVIRVHSDGRWPVDEFTLEQDRSHVLAPARKRSTPYRRPRGWRPSGSARTCRTPA